MDLRSLEEIAQEALSEHGRFDFSAVQANGYLTLKIRRAISLDHVKREGVGRQATISTSGVEAFYLLLDDLYEWRDFDWEKGGQIEIVRLMIRLAMVYLEGDELKCIRNGFLGRHKSYSLDLGNQSYLFELVGKVARK